MTYKALVYFEDLRDNRRAYRAGDVFPRAGFTPSAERIAELLSANNKRGKAVIEAIPDKEDEKPAEPVPDFMNAPIIAEKETEQEVVLPETAKIRRGRKRKESD